MSRPATVISSARSTASPAAVSVPGTARHVAYSARSGTTKFRSPWADFNKQLAEEAGRVPLMPQRIPVPSASISLPVGGQAVGPPAAAVRGISPQQSEPTAVHRTTSPVAAVARMVSPSPGPTPLVSVRGTSPQPRLLSVRSPSQTMLTRQGSSPQPIGVMTLLPDQTVLSGVPPSGGSTSLPQPAAAPGADGVVRMPTWQMPAQLTRYRSTPVLTTRTYSASPERAFATDMSQTAQITLLKQALETERRKRANDVQALRRDLDAQQEVLDDLVQVLQCVAGGKPGGRIQDMKLPETISLSTNLEELKSSLEAQEKQQSLQAEAVREGLILLNEGLEAFQLQRQQLTEELKQRQGTSVPSTARTDGVANQPVATTGDLAALNENLQQKLQDAVEQLESKQTSFRETFDAAADGGGKKYLNIAADVAQLWDVFEQRVREINARVDALEGIPQGDARGMLGDTGGASVGGHMMDDGGIGGLMSNPNTNSPSLREIQDIHTELQTSYRRLQQQCDSVLDSSSQR